MLYEFKFPKGLPFFKRLKLKELCRNIDLDAPGYSSIIALASKVNSDYNLNVALTFVSGSIMFIFK